MQIKNISNNIFPKYNFAKNKQEKPVQIQVQNFAPITSPLSYKHCATLKSNIIFKGHSTDPRYIVDKLEDLTQEKLPKAARNRILELKKEEIKRFEKILNNKNLAQGIRDEALKIDYLINLVRKEKEEEFENILNGLKDGADLYELYGIIDNNSWNTYQDLIKTGENAKCASILTNIQDLKNYNTEDYRKIINFLNNFEEKQVRTSIIISQYFRDMRPKSLHKIANFAEKIDVKNFKNIVDKNYSQSQILDFLEFHARKTKNPNFTKEKLIFLPDLTEFLKTNYVNADSINKILSFYPNTSRQIGEIPADWLDKTKEKPAKAKEKIYRAIETFTSSHNTKGLSTSLSKTLNKEVKVNKIGEGCYGIVYAIEIEGAQKTCLKIFKQNAVSTNTSKKNIHGEFIEPQIALYANKHYGDDFAKFYFGNLGHIEKKDNKGFMVLEFLDENSRKKEGSSKHKSYSCGDVQNNHNIINNIIFDFGAIYPLDMFGNKIKSWQL